MSKPHTIVTIRIPCALGDDAGLTAAVMKVAAEVRHGSRETSPHDSTGVTWHAKEAPVAIGPEGGPPDPGKTIHLHRSAEYLRALDDCARLADAAAKAPTAQDAAVLAIGIRGLALIGPEGGPPDPGLAAPHLAETDLCPRCNREECSPECIAAEQAESGAYTGPRPTKFA